MRDKTAFGLVAALALGGMLALGAVPAFAQEPAPDCETGVIGDNYLASDDDPTVSNQAPLTGETITATSGVGMFDPGSSVEVLLFSDPVIDLGDVLAEGTGEARITFEVPESVDPGPVLLRFSGLLGGELNQVGICLDVQPPAVLGTTFTRPPAQPAALPFTGSVELLTVAVAGAALLGLGAVSLVVTRRRRDRTDPVVGSAA